MTGKLFKECFRWTVDLLATAVRGLRSVGMFPGLTLLLLLGFQIGIVELAHRSDKVPRISATEAKRLVDEEGAVIVDVRAAPLYDRGHIVGALNLPANQLAGRLQELPQDKLIITYCS